MFETIEDFYNRNLFLDAYSLCQHFFEDTERIKSETIRSITLLGRLAMRLGSRDLSDKIFRIAHDKAPEDPLVIHLFGRSKRYQRNLLLHIEEIESFPRDKLDRLEDEAVWLASSGWVYAMVRDFENAHRFINAANELNITQAWVKCCEAEVLCLEDRWPEALKAAEMSWVISPGMPQVATTLGRVKALMGDIPEAAFTILEAAGKIQSFETLLVGLWYLCAHAERSPKAESEKLAREAWELTDKILPLAPLADQSLLSKMAAIRSDIAWLMNDRVSMKAQAKDLQHPFYQKVIKNIETNETGVEYITGYKSIFQKHNTCLPTSIAAVAHHFGLEINADALAEELTYYGTAIWRVIDWLKERGYTVKPFIVDSKTAKALLEKNIPFVQTRKTVKSYHATAVVGIDEAADVLIIHDPSYSRLDKMLLTETGKEEAPFGPEALAIVSDTDRHLLDVIPAADSEPFVSFLDYMKIQETKGHRSGQQVIEELNARFPESPFIRRLEAIHLGLSGKAGAAIGIQKGLLEQYPDSEHVRQEILDNLWRTGNSALIREILSRIVCQKKIPGSRATQEWIYPPADYVSQYAGFLAIDQSGYNEAVDMLLAAIEREPSHAASYHALGDIQFQQSESEKSLLSYRCAANLELENHHFARAYLDGMAKIGRIAEGFEFLEKRTIKLGGTISGGEVWITLIDAYEDHGYPDKAIESMSRALSMRPEDHYLLSYSVGFWGRMGFKEEEKKNLAALHKIAHRIHFYSAAVTHCRRNGNWRKALINCQSWLEEEPNNIDARREYASLWALAEGMRSALTLTKEWMDANQGNDDLELLYYEYLKDLFEYDRQLEVLRTRLKRNPFDTWAYRELAFVLISLMGSDDNRDKGKIRQEVVQVIERYNELGPKEAAFFAIKAGLAAHDGKQEDAIKIYLKAIALDPEYIYAYREAWNCADDLPENKRRQIFSQMEKLMFRCPGFLHVAKDMANMAAEHFGYSEASKILDKWLVKFSDDPEVLLAKAELLLHYGQGKTDAIKAAALLEDEKTRFPNHLVLRSTLSQAYRILHDDEKWVTTSRELLKRFPLSSKERRQLAEYYQLSDELEQAATILKEGVQFAPLNDELRHDLIALLFRKGEKEGAIELVTESMSKMPENVRFRHEIVELLFANGVDELALKVAKEGTDVYPDGAALWKSYGDALWRSQLNSDIKAVETAYQKALSLNSHLLEAADRLAELYTYQGRFEEARKVCEDQKPFHHQKGGILTRLAWIERQRGNKSGAVRLLTEIVQQWPLERWSWRLLLEWIDEDHEWGLAKEVLKDVNSVMSEDPDFVGDKLCVLHKAGVQNQEIEEEWARLLSNFPENERIHTQRFDLLFEDQKLEEAEKVVDAIEKFVPDSPYFLARKTALKTDLNQFDQAIEAALSMMKLPYDVGVWCRRQVWQAFEDHAQLPYLIRTVLEEWEKGMEIESTFFEMMIKNLHREIEKPGSIERFLSFFKFKGGLEKRLLGLLENAVDRDDQRGSFTAAILDKLVDIDKRGLLIQFAQQHPDFTQNHTRVWQMVGHALVTISRKKNDKARQWLENWRSHPGCDLWVVSNLVVAIQNSKNLNKNQQLKLIHEHTSDAIQHLRADHTHQYMVCKYCEAALRLGRIKDFISCVDQFVTVLSDTESGCWQPEDDIHLPWVILQFSRLFKANSKKELTREMKNFHTELKKRKVGEWVCQVYQNIEFLIPEGF